MRELVLRAFETTPKTKVWCLPKVDANASVGLPSDYTQNPPTYVGKVDALRDAIIAQARVPKMLDGVPLTGTRVADDIRLAVNADDVAKQELRALKDAVEQDTKEDAVTFSFVTADYVRDFRGKTLPRYQELSLKGNLVKQKVFKLHGIH